MSKKKLPKLGLLYLDYVLRFFDKSNFKGWPDKIETVTYHWGNDKKRFINEVKRKKIDILIGNIPATAYETFKEIAAELPGVRFAPSIETQFSNKSKENVTLFCRKHNLSAPHTEIFYDKKKGDEYLKNAKYPKIIKRSYGPSNYGGYYVHKVDSYEEASKLFKIKKYSPMYIQDCVPLKADIRVMLIGHKPVCAFWRIAGEGEWITNTSQGGDMSYDNVPMGALELAVKASKAAKAEYWACDIAEANGKFYILECATAFAAFPYIRDWICQYLMWDFGNGRFPLPHIPLFSWEELGKIDSSLLRTMRHISFSRYKPSVDGEWFVNDVNGAFNMEKAEMSSADDVPDSIAPEELPDVIKEDVKKSEKLHGDIKSAKINLNSASLTDLMTLHGMEDELALEIEKFRKKRVITSAEDMLEIEQVDNQILKIWKESLDDMRVDLNSVSEKVLKKVNEVGKKLSKKIIEYKEKIGRFDSLEQLKEIRGVGKKTFDRIKDKFKI